MDITLRTPEFLQHIVDLIQDLAVEGDSESPAGLGLELLLSIQDLLVFFHHDCTLLEQFTAAQRHVVFSFCERTITALRSSYQGVGHPSRLQILQQVGQISNHVARYAIELEVPMGFFQGVEHGRMLFWQQVLLLRGPFDDLPASLARRLRRTSRRLLSSISHDHVSGELGRELFKQRSSSERFLRFLALARSSRLDPHVLSLSGSTRPYLEAREGPIIILVPAEVSYAVPLIHGQSVLNAITLPGVTTSLLESWIRCIRTRGSDWRTQNSSDHRYSKRATHLRHARHRELLKEIWQCVVEPVVKGVLQLKVS